MRFSLINESLLRLRILAFLLFPLVAFGQVSIGDSQSSAYVADSINFCGDSNGEIFSIVGGVVDYSKFVWSSSSSAVLLQSPYNNDSSRVFASWNPSNVPFSFNLILQDTAQNSSDTLHVNINSLQRIAK